MGSAPLAQCLFTALMKPRDLDRSRGGRASPSSPIAWLSQTEALVQMQRCHLFLAAYGAQKEKKVSRGVALPPGTGGQGDLDVYTRVCVCVRVIDTVKKEKPRSFRFKGSFLDSCLRRFFRPPWPLKALFAAACCHRSRSGPWKTKEMLRAGARRRERSHPALSVKI